MFLWKGDKCSLWENPLKERFPQKYLYFCPLVVSGIAAIHLNWDDLQYWRNPMDKSFNSLSPAIMFPEVNYWCHQRWRSVIAILYINTVQ